MRTIANYGKLLLPVLLLVACDRTEPFAYENENRPEATHTIAYLKTRCDESHYEIVDQTVIRGTITGNNRYGEFPRELIIQDATGGIAIAADYSAADNPYPLGEELLVYCNGLMLYDYGGKIRLGKATDESTCIPREELDRHLRISGRTPERPTAAPIRIDELTPAHIDTYVRIDDVRFPESGIWCDRDPETGRYRTTERTLADAAGHTLAVRTAGTAFYAGEPLPSGNGSLCGIIDYFGGVYSLRITGFETAFVVTPAMPATTYP
ncbi:MAG: DUF5689 domain-containing protein [Alistipes sp.]|nr:DUF5689 domain-containing protein [Alistipes senegalensis]MCM1251131.1 DUF5689 domain-containing protein [Alistipes sp.]